MTKKHRIGEKGEKEAQKFLSQKGYRILETNWRYRRSEIDIIAAFEQSIVFIEVKTRAYDYFGRPENFVTARKKELMIDAARQYMEEVGHEGEIRFDIISVIYAHEQIQSIEHFEDAFFPGIDF